MVEFVFFAVLAVALLAVFVPSIRASAARKAAGDASEALHSKWQNWNGDGSVFIEGAPGFQITESLPLDPPEPVAGVVRIQAR